MQVLLDWVIAPVFTRGVPFVLVPCAPSTGDALPESAASTPCLPWPYTPLSGASWAALPALRPALPARCRVGVAPPPCVLVVRTVLPASCSIIRLGSRLSGRTRLDRGSQPLFSLTCLPKGTCRRQGTVSGSAVAGGPRHSGRVAHGALRVTPSVSTSLSFHALISPPSLSLSAPQPVLATDSLRVACWDLWHVLFCGAAVSWRAFVMFGRVVTPVRQTDAGKFSDLSLYRHVTGHLYRLVLGSAAPPCFGPQGPDCGRAGLNSVSVVEIPQTGRPPRPSALAVPGILRPWYPRSIPPRCGIRE